MTANWAEWQFRAPDTSHVYCLPACLPALCTAEDPCTSPFFKGSNTAKLNRHMTAFMGAALSGGVMRSVCVDRCQHLCYWTGYLTNLCGAQLIGRQMNKHPAVMHLM
jgi:hypothetical protein